MIGEDDGDLLATTKMLMMTVSLVVLIVMFIR